MRKLSRRSLLSGTGSALALGVAGCLGDSDPSNETDDESDDPADTDGNEKLPDRLEDAFKYVYPPDSGTAVLIVQQFGTESEYTLPTHDLESVVTEDTTFEWGVRIGANVSDRSTGMVVIGSISIDESAENVAQQSTRGDFTLYNMDLGADQEVDPLRVFATDGEVLLFGSREWVTGTLDRHAAGEDTYLSTRPGARALIETLGVDSYTGVIEGESLIEDGFGEIEVDIEQMPELLGVRTKRTEDTQTAALAGWYPDGADEAAVSDLETFFESAYMEADESPDLLRDDRVVHIEATSEFVPPEERADPPNGVYYHSYDEDAGEILLELGDGDEVAVDDLTVEFDDEPYGGDWARGKDRVGSGDLIAIDADAVEPGDDISITYDPNAPYSSSFGTTVLRHLPFVVDFDPIEGRARIEYRDGPPLPADRVTIEAHDRTVAPWGGTLSTGDSTTVIDLDIGDQLSVEYERDDGDVVSIYRTALRPPGEFDIQYDGATRTLSIEYPVREDDGQSPWDRPAKREREPITADRYEVRLDGVRADRQWADLGDEIEPGDTLQLQDVSVGTAVSVVWVGPDQEHTISTHRTVPDVEFEYEYESGELTIRHAGGQPVAADKLRLRVMPDERDLTWGDSGEVTEGDTVVVTDLSEESLVIINYERTYLDRVRVIELIDQGAGETATDGESDEADSGTPAQTIKGPDMVGL